METKWFLLANYGEAPLILLSQVCVDFFPGLTPLKLSQKVDAGAINLPVTRIDPRSAKTAKWVHILDLAEWIDQQREEAKKHVFLPEPIPHDAPPRSPGQTELSYKRTLGKWRDQRGGGE